jgi:hypothetical protein
LGIRDPGSKILDLEKNLYRNPDPGVKKAPAILQVRKLMTDRGKGDEI